MVTEQLTACQARLAVAESQAALVAGLEEDVRLWRRKAETHAEQLRHMNTSSGEWETKVAEAEKAMAVLTQQAAEDAARIGAAEDALAQWQAQHQVRTPGGQGVTCV